MPSHSTITSAPAPVGVTRSPTNASTACRDSLSTSSIAAGTTPAWITAVTAATAARMSAKEADSAARAGGSGTRRSVASVTMASVPSDPTSSCVRS